jgi:DNA-binding MarR family transcriptional regulator
MIVMNTSQSAALLRLFDEIPALFHRLRAVAGEVHGQSVSTAGSRGILRSLDRMGPQTVPQMARARTVSRQHIQVLVNGLLKDGLVAGEENPAHRKSPLVRLTAKGKHRLLASQKRESQLLAHAEFRLTAKEIDRAVEALRSLRELLDNEEWSAYVAASD